MAVHLFPNNLSTHAVIQGKTNLGSILHDFYVYKDLDPTGTGDITHYANYNSDINISSHPTKDTNIVLPHPPNNFGRLLDFSDHSTTGTTKDTRLWWFKTYGVHGTTVTRNITLSTSTTRFSVSLFADKKQWWYNTTRLLTPAAITTSIEDIV